MRLTVVTAWGLLLVGPLLGCGDDSSPADGGDAGGEDADVPDSGDADPDAAAEAVPAPDVAAPAPPVLTPCPEGWVEVPPAAAGEVATCDPWPAAGPAVLTPCPAGWREIAAAAPGGVATCDPWPEGGPAACAAGEAHFPGEPGCRPIGSACPAGDWPEELPAGRPAVYVRPGAAGGNGTAALPYGSIADALAAAPSGAVIALAKGVYTEAVVLPAGLALWGACVADTRVEVAAGDVIAGVIGVSGPGAAIRNLTLTGPRRGISMYAGSSAEIAGVLIHDVVESGLAVYAATATVSDLVVRDVQPQPSDLQFGRGISIWHGGQATVDRAVIQRSHEHGIAVGEPDSRLTASDLAVRSTRCRDTDGFDGQGLAAWGGAEVDATRAAFEDSGGSGVMTLEAGTVVRLEDVLIRETRGVDADRTEGDGLIVRLGARVELRRGVIEAVRRTGALLLEDDTTLLLEDAVIRDTDSQGSDGEGGDGLWLDAAGRCEAHRVVLERNRSSGISLMERGSLVGSDLVVRDTRVCRSGLTPAGGLYLDAASEIAVDRLLVERNLQRGIVAFSPGTTLRLTDLVVRDNFDTEPEGSGRGLSLAAGAAGEVSRALLERNEEFGLTVVGDGSSLLAADLVVRDTEPSNDGRIGEGMYAGFGGRLELRRGIVERSHDVGVIAGLEGSTLDLEDLVVRDTRSAANGTRGVGLLVWLGAQATLRRAVIERSRLLGVAAVHPGTTVQLEDVEIRETLEAECGTGSCAGQAGGIGLGSYGEATLELRRFRILDNVLCGAQFSRSPMGGAGGTGDFHEGEVSGHPIGVNVQTEGLDLTRLMDRVLYRDNDRNLDSSALPVPDLGSPF